MFWIRSTPNYESWIHPWKQSPKKRNLDQNINDSKSHIWIFGILFFINNISGSGIQLFYIRPYVSVDIIRAFLKFLNFLTESLKANKSSNFTIQFCSKNLIHFMNLSSLDFENNMLSQHDQKPFSLYKFSSLSLSVWCQKKRLHCNISWRLTTAFLKHC